MDKKTWIAWFIDEASQGEIQDEIQDLPIQLLNIWKEYITPDSEKFSPTGQMRKQSEG